VNNNYCRSNYGLPKIVRLRKEKEMYLKEIEDLEAKKSNLISQNGEEWYIGNAVGFTYQNQFPFNPLWVDKNDRGIEKDDRRFDR